MKITIISLFFITFFSFYLQAEDDQKEKNNPSLYSTKEIARLKIKHPYVFDSLRALEYANISQTTSVAVLPPLSCNTFLNPKKQGAYFTCEIFRLLIRNNKCNPLPDSIIDQIKVKDSENTLKRINNLCETLLESLNKTPFTHQEDDAKKEQKPEKNDLNLYSYWYYPIKSTLENTPCQDIFSNDKGFLTEETRTLCFMLKTDRYKNIITSLSKKIIDKK